MNRKTIMNMENCTLAFFFFCEIKWKTIFKGNEK